MTQLREIAYLELDTFSLAGTGNINANFSYWKYPNINLKNLLGNMWDKYDKFTIRLQQLNTNGTTTLGSGSQAGVIAYNMAGLDWINMYYEVGGSIQKWVPITQIVMASGASANYEIINPNPSVGFNFRKGQQIVDLEFQIYQVQSGNFNIITTDTYNNNQMTLTIEPAEDNENEMAAMILNTSTAVVTQGKIMSNNNNVFTYTNFNIKDVCREFWDKYEDFELIYANYTASGIGTTTIDISCQNVAIKGFDFLNNSMGTGSGNFETDTALLACNKYGQTGSTHTYDTLMTNRVQFKKTNNTMTLQLQFRQYNNSSISTFTGTSNRRWQGVFFIKPIRPELGCSEKGTLVLSGAGMTTTDATFGVTNATQTDTTWRNINLRNACRGFWDKYNKFNIFLNQSQNNVTTTTAQQQCLMLYMKGLNFESPWTNDTSIGSMTWTIGGCLEGHTITSQSIFQVSNGNTRGIMFNKSKEIVDINMFLKTIDGTALASSGGLNGTFIFTIVGVEE